MAVSAVTEATVLPVAGLAGRLPWPRISCWRALMVGVSSPWLGDVGAVPGAA